MLLATAVVLVPAVALVAWQYRQSRELLNTTQVAVKENLRETLLSISRKTEVEIARLSDEAFQPISKATLTSTDKSKLVEHFRAFTRSHPEVAELSVVPTCASPGKQPRIDFFSKDKWREVHQRDQDAREILAAFNSAQAAADPEPDHRKFVFWQQSCNCKKGPPIYVFRTAPDGFLGMTLDFDYVQQHYLAKLLKDTVDSKASGSNGPLVISVLGENRKEIFATGGRPSEYDVVIAFAPVFPRWQLAAGYSDVTIAGLARRNFETNLLVDGTTVTLLLAGILLTLRAATRQVKLAQAKSSFVANVSHELKTPLSLIRLFAEILELGRATSKEKEHEYYSIIHRESRRLTQLINNILDFSKIEARRKHYLFTSCNVASIVEDVLNTYEYQITASGFELTTYIASALPMARVDQDAIAQAVLNLLNNAIRYSADSKKLEVRVEGRDGQIAIEVADRGIGIPRSEHEKIFEKFYRVDNDLAQTAHGTGLGLALVKHIVDAHSGKILVDSAPGKGSRFTILLPCDPVAVASSTSQSASQGYAIAESPNH
ncbi:MAG TPA: HAMP domain-containing sensor histidine kinase [Candidatus Angelobacter sp.]